MMNQARLDDDGDSEGEGDAQSASGRSVRTNVSMAGREGGNGHRGGYQTTVAEDIAKIAESAILAGGGGHAMHLAFCEKRRNKMNQKHDGDYAEFARKIASKFAKQMGKRVKRVESFAVFCMPKT